ncbi:MAG: histidine--tRNA ligase [Polyangiaceae bacterium]|nr:histidine--tRNA ligase [Polyangiaceae bacterium]MCW5791430.1 histidine--tRNA ligase [Polyangiaceae bacterium]
MLDILPVKTKGEYPAAIEHWRALEQAFVSHVARYGFAEIRTPLLEYTELFSRSIGETTDVVEKEMYAFERHRDHLCLRPEGTASAARAYVQHSAYAQEPVSRWYYLGPMFRAERPQRGRYRQFHQAGGEIFGDAGPAVDAELIEMLVSLFQSLGIEGVTVHLNSLGGDASRARYREALLAYLTPLKSQLSEDSQRRLEKNPLRVLDSKAPEDQAALAHAPRLGSCLSEEDAAHFAGVQRYLEALGVPFVIDPTLVRGLDYYNRTLFELKATGGELGAQNTLCGGGRYDSMVKGLGGPEVPAIGFAIGLERILLTLGERALEAPPRVFVAPLGEAATARALRLGRELRQAGVHTDVDARGNSLKSMLRRASGLGARFVLVLGESELARGVVQLKDFGAPSEAQLSSGQQRQARGAADPRDAGQARGAPSEGDRGVGSPPEVPLDDVVHLVARAIGAAS